MFYIGILVTLFLVLFFLKITTENFMPLNDTYKKDLLKVEPIKIPYSEFLIDLDNNFKNELNKVQPEKSLNNTFKQKVLCDDKINIQVQKDALNKAFDKVSSNYPNLLLFEGSANFERNKHDQQAYINPQQISKHISEENKFSNKWYTDKIDISLKNQNKTMILQDIKFQDDPDFNLDDSKNLHGNFDDLDPCLYKAHQLSQYTNPKMYLTQGTIYFPPRFMKNSPYKNTPLPKTTNLKLWTDMYNCCQNNF